MDHTFKPSRRSFVIGALATALVVPIIGCKYTDDEDTLPEDTIQPNAFVKYTADDRVIIVTGQVEMGQGTYTSLAQCVAEELDVNWQKVEVEAAPVGEAYFNPMFKLQTTAASSSTPLYFMPMREAGAAARDIFRQAAASEWKIDVDSIETNDGFVIAPDGRRRRYGELIDLARSIQPRENLRLKEKNDFRYIGKSIGRLDAKAKASGDPIYGIDFAPDGHLVAVVARKPTVNSKLQSHSGNKLANFPDIEKVVEIPSGVAIIAKHFWVAKSARDQLEISWDIPNDDKLSSADLASQYAKLIERPGKKQISFGADGTQIDQDVASLSADYILPYQPHAPLEPMNCTIHFRDGKCDYWAGTHLQNVDRDKIAEVLGLSADDVKIHTLYMGGSFGRRAEPGSELAAEAAHLAKEARSLGVPIKLMWTREDEMTGGQYRPMSHSRISALTDDAGLPIKWHHRIVARSMAHGGAFEGMIVQNGMDILSTAGAPNKAYNTQSYYLDLHSPNAGQTVIPWRAVGHNHTDFAQESFVDELAVSAGVDPFDYRKRILNPDAARAGNVLDRLKKLSKWTGRTESGVGRGLAMNSFFDTFVAVVLDVTIEDDQPVVKRAFCAVDCGFAVNPRGVEMQLEGGLIFGLSSALDGHFSIKDGVAEQRNYDGFRPLRMSKSPDIEIEIIQSGDIPFNVAESATPLAAPALTNAIFSATGKRLRSLPVSAR